MDSKSGGTRGHGGVKEDPCKEVAGHNSTMCSMLAQNCTWSIKREICHLAHQMHDVDGERGSGRLGKGHIKEDFCTKAAGRNGSTCVSLGPKCIWIVSRSICRSSNLEHDKDDRDRNEHHLGADEHQDKEDICFKRAGHDEDKCKAAALTGKCAWSSMEHSCFSVVGHKADEANRHEGDNDDRSEERIGDVLHEPSTRDNETGSEVVDTISLTLRLSNLQFSLLSAHPSVLSELQSKVKRVIATTAGKDVLPSDVALDVMPGSVIILASLKTFSGRQSSSDTIQSNLNNDQMLQDITSEVKAIDGIESVVTGDVSTSIVEAPAIHTTSVSPSTAESQSKLSFIVGSLAGGVAMLSMVSCGCLLYRRIARSAHKNVEAELHVIGKEIQLDV
jgi:hypothetical protein